MIIDLHARDDAIVDTVMNRSDSHFARRVVRKIVVDGVQQFDGAPIQAFVPVLVVKKTIYALWLGPPASFVLHFRWPVPPEMSRKREWIGETAKIE